MKDRDTIVTLQKSLTYWMKKCADLVALLPPEVFEKHLSEEYDVAYHRGEIRPMTL
jgi:hypothetical protein